MPLRWTVAIRPVPPSTSAEEDKRMQGETVSLPRPLTAGSRLQSHPRQQTTICILPLLSIPWVALSTPFGAETNDLGLRQTTIRIADGRSTVHVRRPTGTGGLGSEGGSENTVRPRCRMHDPPPPFGNLRTPVMNWGEERSRPGFPLRASTGFPRPSRVFRPDPPSRSHLSFTSRAERRSCGLAI